MKTNLQPPHSHGFKYAGKRFHTFFVSVTQSGVRDAAHDALYWCNGTTVPVIAESAAAACNLIKDEIGHLVSYPTEIKTMGPKGGVTSRFIGWESLIGLRMFAMRSNYEQPTLWKNHESKL